MDTVFRSDLPALTAPARKALLESLENLILAAYRLESAQPAAQPPE